MLHRLSEHYPNPNELRLNTAIMNREYEKNLEEYVVDCFRSISAVLPNIGLLNWEFIIDVDKVNQSSYERTRSTVKAEQNKKYAYINDSRLGELKLYFKVTLSDNTEETYMVKLLIPVQDERGYFYIKGIQYVSQYQLTEISTYVTPGTIVTKSLMPIKVKRGKIEAKDIDGNTHILNWFRVQMFTSFTNALFFFFAKYGWYNTLEIFSVGKFIEVIDNVDDGLDPEYTYLKISNNLFIKVNTRALGSPYVQSIVGTIVDAVNNRTTYEEVIDKRAWVCKIGATKKSSQKESHYELGMRHLVLFNRMLDDSTDDVLRLNPNNKGDIYSVIRWMMQNYDELRQKDNLDILNKRLRGNEYIASLLNGTISEKIKRLVNTTSNTREKELTKYKNFFSYKGNELISKCHKSGLIKYDDLVNDMTMFQKFKITMKGPNAIGNKVSRNVSAKMRGLHVSQIGHVGLTTCSPSDPGLTNYVNPLCETDGLFFKESLPEPERFIERLYSELGIPVTDESQNSIVMVDPVKYNSVLKSLRTIDMTMIGAPTESNTLMVDLMSR
jgi:hypothetical protein